MKRPLLATLTVSMLCALAWAGGGAAQETPPGAAPGPGGEVLVRYRDGVTPAVGARYNALLDVWVIAAQSARTLNYLIASLESDPNVDLVQPQYEYVHAVEPSDELYRSVQQVHYRTINLQAAWDVTAGGQPVTVAVIDGGVDVRHPELDTRIWINAEEVPGNQVDDDGNGCVDDVNGCSYQTVPPSGAIADDDGHGTFVAGLVAAEADGVGAVGVADNALIMPVRALNSLGSGSTEQLAQSILYAARNGADVINLSLVVPPLAGTCPRDLVVEETLREAHDVHGATIVAASGNFGLNCVGFPASSEYSLAVAASGPAENSDSRAFFSQWGPEVGVAAPGVGIVSTCPIPTNRRTQFCPGDPYGMGDGTSFSTPVAAGVAALLLGSEPELTPAQVRDRLKTTARDVPDEDRPHWDGAGILDAGGALGAGSAFASLDIRGRDLDAISARVAVGDPSSPDCAAPLWEQAQLGVTSVHATLGVGACAQFWPPASAAPWSLVVDAALGKAATVNSFALSADGVACANDEPINLAPNARTVVQIDCSSDTRVANDDISNATVAATLPRRYEQDVRYATGGGDPTPTCADQTSRGVWYEVPAMGGGTSFAANTLDSGFDTVLAVYRQDGNALTEVACNDDFLGAQSRVVWTANSASKYLVLAAALANVPAHALRLSIAPVDIPENDLADTSLALDLAATYPTLDPAHSATAQPSDPAVSCAEPYGFSLWYSVSPPENGQVRVQTAGSNYDTVLAVFEETPGGLQEVACNDDASGSTRTSTANWIGQAGRDYLIVVGSFRGRAAGVLHIQAQQ